MKTIVVRYKTTEAHGDANAALIRAVFSELQERRPPGLRYTSYRAADGVSFVHLATHEAPDGSALTTLPAFKAFQQQLRSRCAEPPVITELSVVGSYDAPAVES
jgi:hypothetical protein